MSSRRDEPGQVDLLHELEQVQWHEDERWPRVGGRDWSSWLPAWTDMTASERDEYSELVREADAYDEPEDCCIHVDEDYNDLPGHAPDCDEPDRYPQMCEAIRGYEDAMRAKYAGRPRDNGGRSGERPADRRWPTFGLPWPERLPVWRQLTDDERDTFVRLTLVSHQNLEESMECCPHEVLGHHRHGCETERRRFAGSEELTAFTYAVLTRYAPDDDHSDYAPEGREQRRWPPSGGIAWEKRLPVWSSLSESERDSYSEMVDLCDRSRWDTLRCCIHSLDGHWPNCDTEALHRAAIARRKGFEAKMLAKYGAPGTTPLSAGSQVAPSTGGDQVAPPVASGSTQPARGVLIGDWSVDRKAIGSPNPSLRRAARINLVFAAAVGSLIAAVPIFVIGFVLGHAVLGAAIAAVVWLIYTVASIRRRLQEVA